MGNLVFAPSFFHISQNLCRNTVLDNYAIKGTKWDVEITVK